MTIKFLVTIDRINAVMNPVEYFGLMEGKMVEHFHAMLKFMVDDDGNYLTEAQALEVMRGTDMKSFWSDHASAFAKALRDAFVSPTKGGG